MFMSLDALWQKEQRFLSNRMKFLLDILWDLWIACQKN